mmetsp:Transcript_16846/g.36503  ORF Transcript_16846/g.36503 Transcript_16846/m.36503 type:complete len:212 (+) Transcript_16846:65-700(+)|eukprot:CAMPEP_0172551910 /NCGR_PEP_ID=MMETSP1067-20121228/42176_1 /TAXON_ID=265564 ORGANISM="Thalassiosira punctigera, Strain Tpunct2005C2" /NCGR_SAMPLE_ID=MMETSP1067 /ASSEMBLY_ACC=CAM_ASM_000444 /LENGTH=211 /DNA_ID=CAMNT_0013339775 /DNA_START=65 /DNA_END=700 /DNA_ORIENTATION=+
MPGKIETDARGIPLKSATPDAVPVPVLYGIFTTVFSGVAGTIAYLAIVRDNPAADSKIAILSEYDLGYLYLAAFVLKLGQFAMGINLACARKASKVNVPDQQVYQVKGAEGSKLGYVLLEYDGVIGKFNRAQRAVQNYNESFPQNALYVLLGGLVYPREVSALVTFFAVARLFSAIGYTGSADGRMAGFLIANLSISVVEALVVISGCRSL